MLFCPAMKRLLLSLALLGTMVPASAQHRYVNPVLHLDYSDPDVCRVGDDYYLTASSFNQIPGLPILHSCDLVRWERIGAALPGIVRWHRTVRQAPPAHGKGVWAPSIRYHDGWFYIFYGDPDQGIFQIRTQHPAGRWEAPVPVVKGKGFIDPCPLWDDAGRAWLSFACAGSRAGLKSVILVAEMDPSGEKLLSPPRIVYDGHATQPTIEGTKFYQRDGQYYIFAPAGGVATGWQTVLRAADPYGPYEERVVLAAAKGTVNGPHQGAWVETPSGEHWFLHFQDKGAYGRIVHLQPMVWKDDGWPLIGKDPDGDGVGQPVTGGPVPRVAASSAQAADEGYRPLGLPLEWQYPDVPSPLWHYALPSDGVRLFAVEQGSYVRNLWDCNNLLQQMFPAERFTVTARLDFRPKAGHGERAGFAVMGRDYASLVLDENGSLQYVVCRNADKGSAETARPLCQIPLRRTKPSYPYASPGVPAVNYPEVVEMSLWVRLTVNPHPVEGNVPEAVCRFSYSLDGTSFTQVEESFTAREGMWIGARWGFFCNATASSNDAGSLDVTQLEVKPK